jgi:hypothetical protein
VTAEANGIGNIDAGRIYIMFSATSLTAANTTTETVVSDWTWDFPATKIDTVVGDPSGRPLDADKQYWFAAILVDSIVGAPSPAWHLRSPAVIATAKTDEAGGVDNIVKIDTAFYVDERMGFQVRFSLIEEREVCTAPLNYTYSVKVGGAAGATVVPGPAGGLPTQLCKAGDRDSVFIPLSPVKFDTSYAVFLHVVGSSSGGGYPVPVGSFKVQTVVLKGEADTGRVANDMFMVMGGGEWSAGGLNETATVTVAWSPSAGMLDTAGFILVGGGYKIRDVPWEIKLDRAVLSVGIKAPSIPAGYKESDVKVYRWVGSRDNDG